MRETDNTIGPPDGEPILSENAMTVLENRYLIRDEQGKIIETPGQLFSRVARLVASIETNYGSNEAETAQWHKKYYDLMASLKFLPNSPTLMNAGRPSGMLSACFVLPIEDSIEGIFETVKDTALIQKAGGGTGFSLDRLRPTGDRVASSGGTTSGPISFWRVFSHTTDAIQQGAFRRGANMGMMSVTHPDILRFIHAKQDLKAFTNFNISIKITDAWMNALETKPNMLHVVENPRTNRKYLLPKQIDIEHYTIQDLFPLSGDNAEGVENKDRFYTIGDLWNTIITCAHKTGDPGVAFIDRINKDNPTPALGEIEATNPCGEQPLLPYEACTLGSINLAKFVTDKSEIDWPALAQATKLGVRLLDNIIDACHYPVTETAEIAKANRKIGLGVMGFADCLFMLGIPYDSNEGVAVGESIMKFINENAIQASNELAQKRGCFPNWPDSIWNKERNLKVRNAAITCVAPTGTISIIADCSSGIEPLYSLVFVRQVLSGQKLLQTNPVFSEIASNRGIRSEDIARQALQTGSIQTIPSIPAEIRKIFKCAYDIAPEWHIRMQAGFQKHCDAAVSKTINFAEKAKAASVDKAYRLAYYLGCKGITIYRRKSRPNEPMTLC
ncbi:MAG: adenosylcobalamin-dependent ribonucleoside-diphosphate reductase [Sedimentisphaerales bacterium]|jgi:ribonucleoside-diphosphate reductase alpha chain